MVGTLLTWTTMWVFRREPFFLPFYSPCILTPSHHVTLLKYAVDFVFFCSYSKLSDQDVLDDDLHRRLTCSADHGLIINKNKYAECLFCPKNNSAKLTLSLINGEALSWDQTVRCLGVHFTSNLKGPPTLRWFQKLLVKCTNWYRSLLFHIKIKCAILAW